MRCEDAALAAAAGVWRVSGVIDVNLAQSHYL
jgi:hypothetical protein